MQRRSLRHTRSRAIRIAMMVTSVAITPFAVAATAHVPAAVATVSSTSSSSTPSIAGSTSVSTAPRLQVNEDHAGPIPTASREIANFRDLWDAMTTNNSSLRIALDEYERAEAATRVAWAGVLPTLNGTGQLVYNSVGTGSACPGTITSGGICVNAAGTPTQQIGYHTTASASLTLLVPLLNFRNIHAIGTARVQERVDALQIAEVRREVGLNLAKAVVAIASAEKQAELNRIGLDAAIDSLILTKRKVAAGVGDQRDVVNAQQAVSAARTAIPTGDELLVEAREALATLLNIVGDVGVGRDPGALEGNILAFCGDGSASAKDRTDVLVAKEQIVVAERNVDDITLAFAPTLTGQLVGGVLRTPIFGSPSIEADSYQGYLTLTIPFYDGGVRYGQKRDRVALVDEAKATELSTEVAAEIQQAQGRRAITVALESDVVSREARDLAKEYDRLIRLAYATGIDTNFDLVLADQKLRTAESQLIEADLTLASARVSLPFIEGRCASVTK